MQSNHERTRESAASLVKKLGRKLRILGIFPNEGGCTLWPKK